MHTPPSIKLVDFTKNPYNLSIASARTCYSSKGIIYPEDVDRDDKARELRDSIAKSTLKAGHLTTRQHPQFIFAIDKVSRNFVWSFLHSHPFYNSEQVSQRYVEVKPDQFYYPPNLSEKLFRSYQRGIENASKAYYDFITEVMPSVSKEYFQIYKGREKGNPKWDKSIHKRAIEIARYFLPLGTHTYLYHTINGLTLHRYYRMMKEGNLPEEQEIVVRAMVEEGRKFAPDYFHEFSEQGNEINDRIGVPEKVDVTSGEKFIKEFDLSMNGKSSVLFGKLDTGIKPMIESWRIAHGFSSEHIEESEIIERLMNPAMNQLLTSTLGELQMGLSEKSMSALKLVFKKKISHTADSQGQRHRTVPATRPILMRQYGGKPDYITPQVVMKDIQLHEVYKEKMEKIFNALNDFLSEGGSPEHASYLLPNAFPIRFIESGDLLSYHHKWKSRLCYNAQEEIFYSSLDEISEIRKNYPEIYKFLGAPCRLRFLGGEKPFCPEGDKWCGVKVWQKSPEDYERII